MESDFANKNSNEFSTFFYPSLEKRDLLWEQREKWNVSCETSETFMNKLFKNCTILVLRMLSQRKLVHRFSPFNFRTCVKLPKTFLCFLGPFGGDTLRLHFVILFAPHAFAALVISPTGKVMARTFVRVLAYRYTGRARAIFIAPQQLASTPPFSFF